MELTDDSARRLFAYIIYDSLPRAPKGGVRWYTGERCRVRGCRPIRPAKLIFSP